MDKTKQTLAIALAAVLAVLAGGWFLLVSPQRANVTSLKAKTITQDQTNTSLQTKITALKAELVQLPEAKAQLEAVARRLPPDLAEVSLIQTLTKAAADANVDLQIITPGAPTAVGAPAATVIAPTTSASATGSTAKTGDTPAPVTAPAAAPAAPANPAGNLYAVPVALTVQGDYFDLEMFVHNLEGMQRALLVSSLNITRPTVNAPLVGAAISTAAPAPAHGKTGAKTTSKTTSKTTGKTTGKTLSKVKPVPGSAAAAQAEAGKLPGFVADQNTLTVTIAATVYSLYTTTPAPAVVPTAAPTSAPTK
jgi:Tfp pilus assembly protein PilO